MVISCRGTLGVSGVALYSFPGAFRPVLHHRQVWIAPVRAPCADHGTLRRVASRLLEVRAWRCRFGRSSSQRFAPATSRRPSHHANPKMADEESARLARRDSEKRFAKVCRVLEAFRPRP